MVLAARKRPATWTIRLSVGLDLTWSGGMTSGPWMGKHPGSRSGSVRSWNSSWTEAASSGRWRKSVGTWMLPGKKSHLRHTPAALPGSLVLPAYSLVADLRVDSMELFELKGSSPFSILA